MRHLLLGIIICIYATSCQESNTTEKPPCESFDDADKELLELIEQIKRKSSDQDFLRRFEMAQVYWVQYRDRHLRALYPHDWDIYYRKEFNPETFNTCKCKELKRMTDLRIKELSSWLKNDIVNQEECPSTRSELSK